MRSFLRAALDCFVWNEPRVATTTQIAPACMPPARNVALVLIRNSDSEPIELDATVFAEVKNIFVAVVQKPPRTNRLKMAVRLQIAVSIFNRDRLDPVNCVLQNKQISEFDYNFMGQHRVGWRRANIEKKRAAGF
jgi:hypothetical protein